MFRVNSWHPPVVARGVRRKLIDKNSPVPIYYQIREALANEITAGEYPPGSPIPSERELSERFRVSRMTVRQATRMLVGEGLCYRRRGMGIYVAEKKYPSETQAFMGFTNMVRLRGLAPSSKVLECRWIQADESLAGMLELDVGARVAYIKRIRYASGEPLGIETSHVPEACHPRLLDHDFETESLYHVMELYGIHPSHAKDTLYPSFLDREEAQILGLKPRTLAIRRRRIAYVVDWTPVEMTLSVYHPDKFTFEFDLKYKG